MGAWDRGVLEALSSLDEIADRSLAVRKSQMPNRVDRHSRLRKKKGRYRDAKFRSYALSAKQHELVGYLVSCGPGGCSKKELYGAVYAPEDIQPYRMDYDIEACNKQLGGVGYRIRYSRARRWIEAIRKPSDAGIPVLLEDFGVEVRMKPARRILRHLMDCPSRGAAQAELIDVLYEDDPEGGPLDAGGVVKVHIFNLRRLLEPDFVIDRIGGGRYRLMKA